MTCASRRSSVQIEHSGPSETLKHRSQNDTFSFTSAMARARRSASSRESFSKWNAMRWAPFGPTPGIRPSSSIRSCTGPAYTSGQTQHSTEAAERLLLGSIHLVHGIVQGGQHEVLQNLDIVRVNSVRADAHGPELHTRG